MNVRFLGQGYTTSVENAVGTLLVQYLSEEHFRSFTCISAFTSEAALKGLHSHLENAKHFFENLTFIVGIDQGGTSKSALIALNELEVSSFVFYQKEAPIFHPKIYLFEGRENRLIIGSSNLTAQGLFGNVESSLLIEFSVGDTEAMALVQELKSYYSGLFNLTDPNLFKLTNKLIEELVEV